MMADGDSPASAPSGFTPLRRTLYIVACVAASAAGWQAGMRAIPIEQRRPPSPLPVGSLHVLRDRAPAALIARDLRDWRFARENGLELPELMASERVVLLPHGARIRVVEGDLDLVRIENSDRAGEQLWMAAEDLLGGDTARDGAGQ